MSDDTVLTWRVDEDARAVGAAVLSAVTGWTFTPEVLAEIWSARNDDDSWWRWIATECDALGASLEVADGTATLRLPHPHDEEERDSQTDQS